MTARPLYVHADLVMRAVPRMQALEMAIADAHGATLVDDVVASAPVPAVELAACDGYAVLASDVAAARLGSPIELPVPRDISVVAVGHSRHVPGTAVRIASGAPMPLGADAVVAVADTDGGVSRVAIGSRTSPGANVTRVGFDVAAGATVLAAGTRLGSRHIALAAALGISRLTVVPVPRVAVLPVGDELVEGTSARPHASIPEVTGRLLVGLLQDAGVRAFRAPPVGDDRAALRGAVEDHLVRADLLITIGGLSAGERDTVASVVGSMGDFDVADVLLAPGGRHGVGVVHGGGRSVPILALPGKPVAALAAFEAYARDAVRAMGGGAHDAHTVAATATAGWRSPAGMVQAIPVLLEGGGSVGWRASPVGDPLHPSWTDVVRANGLALVPEDATEIRDGTILDCVRWEA